MSRFEQTGGGSALKAYDTFANAAQERVLKVILQSA
jgi:hypothetical protein